MGDRRDKALKELRDQLAIKEQGLPSNIEKQNLWDSSGFKIAASLSMLILGILESKDVHIFGYARTKISDVESRDRIKGYLPQGKEGNKDVSKFLQLIKYVSGAYDAPEGFQALDSAIYEHEVSKNSTEGSSRRLFYLAFPPSVYPCKMIRNHAMNKCIFPY